MTETAERHPLNHNLHARSLALLGEIFEEHVNGADDVFWDLSPVLMVEPGPNGQPQPASRYLLLAYTKSNMPSTIPATIATFDILLSPMQLLDGAFMRDTIIKAVTAVREQRQKQSFGI